MVILDKKNIAQKEQVQKQIIKQRKYLGTFKPYPGQFVWEFNVMSGSIDKASFDETTVDLKGNKTNKIIAKDNCLYCVAINKNNAEAKFLKEFKI